MTRRPAVRGRPNAVPLAGTEADRAAGTMAPMGMAVPAASRAAPKEVMTPAGIQVQEAAGTEGAGGRAAKAAGAVPGRAGVVAAEAGVAAAEAGVAAAEAGVAAAVQATSEAEVAGTGAAAARTR